MPPRAEHRAPKWTLASKSTAVIGRFGLRTMVLVAFAAFGRIGFEHGLTVLLWMATILSAMLATIDRDEPFDLTLNHWDEAMAYAALCSLACAFDPPVL